MPATSLRTSALAALLTFAFAACSGGGGGPAVVDRGTQATSFAAPASTEATVVALANVVGQHPKSAKRGLAYDIADAGDLGALSRGLTWWYNWDVSPNEALPAGAGARAGIAFDPMLWNGDFDPDTVVAYYRANPGDPYLLVLNEPNVAGQAYLSPQDAAALWPSYEAVASRAGVKIVGPAITWGTMPGYEDPVAWLDAFYAAYRAAHAGHDPRIDYLAFHWYDYGLAAQLDRLGKYHKPIWVTEFANWHSQDDGAQIDTLAKQAAQMADMVRVCEQRADVFRYAWFTGRIDPDPHFDSIFGAPGTLLPLGKAYLSLPRS